MEHWDNSTAYEIYMGPWSRLIVREFVKTLKPGGRWLDIGCGTGALTQAVQPDGVTSTDRSPAFVDHVQQHIQDQ